MKYEFEVKPTDYSDLASGSVLRSAPGRPALPVRLASELFQRAHAAWASGRGPGSECTLYDPLCGTAYSLTVLKLLHWNLIKQVIGSDIDPKALELAARNLGLLLPENLRGRVEEITSRVQKFGKSSHMAALQSASRLLTHVERCSSRHRASTSLFLADALQPIELMAGLAGHRPDIIFADVPYGEQTHWTHKLGASDFATVVSLFVAISTVTLPGAVVVAIAPRSYGRFHPNGYHSLAFIKGKGHRHANILRRTD